MKNKDYNKKIIPFAKLSQWRQEIGLSKIVVATNGCFDILHVGHVHYLQQACNLGDILIVGINSNNSVRSLKGPNRPINNEQDRAHVIASLDSVDAVCIFDNMRATQFLKLVKPNIWVKAGDYTIDTLDANEREVVLAGNGKITIVPNIPDVSTTHILKQIEARGL